jgi:periplasmic protein CpxP/Spy
MRMTKNKILILTIAVLLITNSILLILFLNKPGSRSSRREREAALLAFVKKDLAFSPQQLQQFDSLGKWHREKVKTLMESFRSNKTEELKAIAAADFSDSVLILSASRSGNRQRAMELQLFDYFKRIRNLCTAPQREKFDTLYHTLWRRSGNRK